MLVKNMIVKAFIILIAIVMFAILGAFGYGYLDNIGLWEGYENYKFQKKLYLATVSGKKTLKLSELTPFNWDEVCVYEPYMMNSSEETWSIIFSVNNMVVSSMEINRGYVDLLDSSCANYPGYFLLESTKYGRGIKLQNK